MGVSLLDDIRFVLLANQSSVLILRMLLVQRIQSISSNVASDAGAGQNLLVHVQFARAEKRTYRKIFEAIVLEVRSAESSVEAQVLVSQVLSPSMLRMFSIDHHHRRMG